MNAPAIPQTYAHWRHCIEVECGSALTTAFVDERLAAWRNPGHAEARRFEQIYGEEHRRRVHQWFEQARSALA